MLLLVRACEDFNESELEVLEASEVLDKTSELPDNVVEEVKLAGLEDTLDIDVGPDENDEDRDILQLCEEVLDEEGTMDAELGAEERRDEGVERYELLFACLAVVPVTLKLIASVVRFTEAVIWYVEEESTAVEEESDIINELADESEFQRDALADWVVEMSPLCALALA